MPNVAAVLKRLDVIRTFPYRHLRLPPDSMSLECYGYNFNRLEQTIDEDDLGGQAVRRRNQG